MDFEYLLKKIVGERRAELSEMLMSNGIANMEPVSYTHLTLPTMELV